MASTWGKNAARHILATVGRPLARRRLASRLAATSEPRKLEIGAGTGSRPGWISTDVHWRAKCYMDAASTWPMADESASHVYADNVVEHLRMEPNRVLLREAFRVLQPGGRIRLATPDVGRLARMYLDQPEDAAWHVKNAASNGYEAHHPVDLLRIVFQDAGHHVGYLWDFDSLAAELREAGFVNVERRDPRESDDPELRDLEGRNAGHEAAPIELIVEATKP